MKRGDLDEAERQYLGSLAQQPRQQRILGALGVLAMRRDALDDAARRFHEALDLAPSDVDAMSDLGFMDAVRGDTGAAQAWYERAIAIDPTYPHGLMPSRSGGQYPDFDTGMGPVHLGNVGLHFGVTCGW